MTLIRHLVAILVLPFTVSVVMPAWLLQGEAGARLRSIADSPGDGVLFGVGVLLVGLGLSLAGKTILQFARRGRGTLAPWDPPKALVVEGIYRHVRNPMISGVLGVLLGEAAIFRSLAILTWFAGFLALNAVYIPLIEERGLERRFGGPYRRYRQNVPRWIPRRRAWNDDSTT